MCFSFSFHHYFGVLMNVDYLFSSLPFMVHVASFFLFIVELMVINVFQVLDVPDDKCFRFLQCSI